MVDEPCGLGVLDEQSQSFPDAPPGLIDRAALRVTPTDATHRGHPPARTIPFVDDVVCLHDFFNHPGPRHRSRSWSRSSRTRRGDATLSAWSRRTLLISGSVAAPWPSSVPLSMDRSSQSVYLTRQICQGTSDASLGCRRAAPTALQCRRHTGCHANAAKRWPKPSGRGGPPPQQERATLGCSSGRRLIRRGRSLAVAASEASG